MYDENLFVRIYTHLPWDDGPEDCIVHPVDRGKRAFDSTRCAMDLEIFNSDGKARPSVFDYEALSFLCRFIILKNAAVPGPLEQERPRITLNSTVLGLSTTPEKSSIEVHSPKVRALLEPLRSLFRFGEPRIESPISQPYKDLLVPSMTRPLSSVQDIFNPFNASFQRVIADFDVGYRSVTIRRLKGALADLEDCYVRFQGRIWEPPMYFTEGELAGLHVYTAMSRIALKLGLRLAILLLRYGSHDDVEVAAKWSYFIIKKYHKDDSILQAETPRGYEFAEVFCLAAHEGAQLDLIQRGDWRVNPDAARLVLRCLQEALRHEPTNLERALEFEEVKRHMRSGQFEEHARRIHESMRRVHESMRRAHESIWPGVSGG